MSQYEPKKVEIYIDYQPGVHAGWVAQAHYERTGPGARRQQWIEDEPVGPQTDSRVGPDQDPDEFDVLPDGRKAAELAAEYFGVEVDEVEICD